MSVDAVIEDTGRGATVRFGDRYLYSRHQPERRPSVLAEKTPVEHRCIYFIPSPLLGYGLKLFADRLPSDSIILAVEQSEELMALCSPLLPENVVDHPSIVLVRLSDRKSLHSLLYSLGPWKFRRVRRVDLTAGAGVNPDLYNLLSEFLVEDLATYWRNRHAVGRLGRQWIRHIYANQAAMEQGEIEFLNLHGFQPDGVPVVIGAGPSLEASLGFLKLRRSALWILATDTAVSALLDADIVPDAVAVLETQAWNLLDFHGTGQSGITVIGDITAYPPSLGHTGGRCFIVSSEFSELKFLHRISAAGLAPFPIPPLGSVGLAAVEIAMSVRRKDTPVFLTGLDFAYRPGKSHSRGSSFHRWQLTGNSRLNPQPGWEASMNRPRISGTGATGEPLNTDSVLGGYAALLSDRYAGHDGLFVLAPGGLDLGFPVIPQVEAEHILNTRKGRLETPAIPTEAGENVRDDFQKLASAFLDDDERKLGRIIEAWESYAAGMVDSTGLLNALGEMDQIYADFPDEPPLPKNNHSFLVRAVDRSRKLQRYIRRNRQESSSSVRSTERNAD